MKPANKTVIATIILGVCTATFSTTGLAANKPYCSVASNKGYYWWTWTVSPQSRACQVAENKLKSNGYSVNWKWRSYYSDNSGNTGNLVCHRDKTGYLANPWTKIMKGNGVGIFQAAIDHAKSKGWSACYFRMIH
ncbi:MAG: hypothetical protein R3F02_15620 [Thiolinea sp.]